MADAIDGSRVSTDGSAIASPDRDMPENLTWDQAIERVLKDAQKPLHYTDITEKIITGNLRQGVGATPSTTVNVTISNSIRNGHKKYLRLGEGLYALRNLIEAAGAASATQQADIEEVHETGAINAFGMYWRRDEVNWDQARILGKQEGADKVVNFNDQIGVYLLHDRDRVIYIGRAEDALIKRLVAHTTGRFGGRWDRFSRFGIRAVQDDGSLKSGESNWARSDVIQTMEAILIECLEPSQNRRRGDNLGDSEFVQVRDPDFRRAEARRLLDQLLAKAL